jgi:hypothetical protein
MSNEEVGRLFTGTLFTILITHMCEQWFYFEGDLLSLNSFGI